MSPEEHARLFSAHQVCKDACYAQHSHTYFYQNEVFHEVIYADSHHSFLAEQVRSLHRRLRPYRRLQLRVRDLVATSYSKHDEVDQAIIVSNGGLTADFLRKYIMIQGERFADLIMYRFIRDKLTTRHHDFFNITIAQ